MSTSAEGKTTALVTGANSGLGKAIATALAAENKRVGLIVRDRARGETALAEIRAATGNDDLHLFVADLTDQSAIRALAQAVHERFDHLHLLVNNAGTAFPERRLSPQGIECALAVNHLGPFLLTTPAAGSAQGQRAGADRQCRHPHRHGDGFRRSELGAAPLSHDAGLRSVQARQSAFHLRTGAPAAGQRRDGQLRFPGRLQIEPGRHRRRPGRPS